MKKSKSKHKVKKKKKEDNIIKFDYMKTNKDNIMNVINNPFHINTINDISEKTFSNTIQINYIVNNANIVGICKFSELF